MPKSATFKSRFLLAFEILTSNYARIANNKYVGHKTITSACTVNELLPMLKTELSCEMSATNQQSPLSCLFSADRTNMNAKFIIMELLKSRKYTNRSTVSLALLQRACKSCLTTFLHVLHASLLSEAGKAGLRKLK